MAAGLNCLGSTSGIYTPPISIARSFENVIAGFQEKQELINQAIGYANSVVPESRGKAENQVQTAAGGKSYAVTQSPRERPGASRFGCLTPRPGNRFPCHVFIRRP